MNKNELIAKVAKDAKLTKGEAGEAIVATLGEHHEGTCAAATTSGSSASAHSR